MRIDILTIFPDMFASPFEESIVKIAQDKGLLEIHAIDIRGYAKGAHRQVDDYPYGGGPGMVMKPEPIFETLTDLASGKTSDIDKIGRIVLLSPRGKKFSQEMAREFSLEKRLVLICGRYEGVDERVSEIVHDEISIGDYILSGGEFAAMVIVEATARLIPGVVGKEQSVVEESFSQAMLEYSHYTRPADYEGRKVPEVLLSGDHAEIAKWRRKEALRRTLMMRPDLLDEAKLSEEDKKILEELKKRKS